MDMEHRFVDSTYGSDAEGVTGSADQPFRTFAKALSVLRGKAPFVITAMPGIYFEDGGIQIDNKHGGGLKTPSIIRAWRPGDEPNRDPSSHPAIEEYKQTERKWFARIKCPIESKACFGLLIEGFEINGFRDGVEVNDGIVWIRDCWIHHNFGHGVQGTGNAVIEVHHCLVEFNANSPHGKHGLYFPVCERVVVTGCIVRHNCGYGIKVRDNTTPDPEGSYAVELYSNIIHDNLEGSILLEWDNGSTYVTPRPTAAIVHNTMVGPAMKHLSTQAAGDHYNVKRANNIIEMDGGGCINHFDVLSDRKGAPDPYDPRPQEVPTDLKIGDDGDLIVSRNQAKMMFLSYRKRVFVLISAERIPAGEPSWHNKSKFWAESPVDNQVRVGALPFVPAIAFWAEFKRHLLLEHNGGWPYSNDHPRPPDLWRLKNI